MTAKRIYGWTLEAIHLRCDEEGDCKVWRLGTQASGLPVARINGRSTQSVRRHVYELVHGPLRADRIPVMRCGCASCLEPSHMTATTHRALRTSMAKKGLSKLRPSVVASITTARRKVAKLDMGKARAIRARHEAGETQTALAAEFGVTHSAVQKVIAHVIWRESVASSSVFVWAQAA